MPRDYADMMPANVRILVVDDNPAALYATSRVLRSAGYQVLEACTGDAALKRAADADLVVLDINLPDVDGFEVCRYLRGDPRTAKLPVVHLSATFMQKEDFEIGLAAGADSYLTRPVEPLVLLATVQTLLFARQAEIVRRDLDATLRTMFNLSPVAIAILDAGLRYRSVNPAYVSLMGRTSEELHVRPDAPEPPSPTDELLGSVRQHIGQGDVSSGDLVVHRPDGTAAEVNWEIARESVSGVIVLLARDVTAQRAADREREQLLASERAARADAERSNRLKEEFLATLSHELRNPLNAILGWATVLSNVPDLSKNVSAAVQAIARNAQIQAQMIGDLLEYAGISFGKLRLQMCVISPYPIVQSAVDVLVPAARARDIAIKLTLGADGARISGDAVRLQQIVLNLLGNAIKFSTDGASVEVTAGSSGDHFRLVVRDQGMGISPDFLPHIFERFSQQDASTTRAHGGLGLGLAIVKHLVDLHEGTISADSAGEGLGATFTVLIPTVRDTQAVAHPGHVEEISEDVSGMTVLVVEDDVDSRALIARILGDAGATVRQAGNAAAALLAVEHGAVDALVSDIGMAGRDGYQLVRELRERGHDAAHLPAIAVTAFARGKDREDAFAAGFQHHLAKPIDPRKLLRAVATFRAARDLRAQREE